MKNSHTTTVQLPIPSRFRDGQCNNAIDLEIEQLPALGIARIIWVGAENIYVLKDGLHYYCKVSGAYEPGYWDFTTQRQLSHVVDVTLRLQFQDGTRCHAAKLDCESGLVFDTRLLSNCDFDSFLLDVSVLVAGQELSAKEGDDGCYRVSTTKLAALKPALVTKAINSDCFSDDALADVLAALIARLSLQSLEAIQETAKDAWHAAMNLGISSQLQAHQDQRAACTAAISSMIRHDKEIVSNTIKQVVASGQ